MIRWLPRPFIPWIGLTPAGTREAFDLSLRHHYQPIIVRDVFDAPVMLTILEQRRAR